MSDKTIISASEIREVLIRQGVPETGIYCLDSTYELLSEDDVQNKLRESFTSVLDRMKIHYVPERHDCENFAVGLWWWTTHWHAKQNDAADNGVALGLMCNSQIRHGFDFAVHRSDAGVLYAVGYEPQRDRFGFSCGQIVVPWKESFLCVC